MRYGLMAASVSVAALAVGAAFAADEFAPAKPHSAIGAPMRPA